MDSNPSKFKSAVLENRNPTRQFLEVGVWRLLKTEIRVAGDEGGEQSDRTEEGEEVLKL